MLEMKNKDESKKQARRKKTIKQFNNKTNQYGFF